MAIDEAAITALAQSLDVASVRCASQGAAFPVRFQTVEEEVQFLLLLNGIRSVSITAACRKELRCERAAISC